MARAEPIPTGRPPRAVRTVLDGVDRAGRPLVVSLVGPSLVVFLSTTCDGCRDLAGLVADGALGISVLGVLRAPDGGLPDRDVDAFVVAGGRWLLGDDPYAAFDVRTGPFFCVVDAGGTLVLEGVGFGREHVEAHVARALAGDPRPDAVRLRPEDA